ncbi:VWA domain-containing protein [Agriterribacter sp.]|uniref:vWA domain-containing protein n=1 Tax=Agriterribacter sp. TaxID=2821509 RepID=UPI002B8C2963|nr:VWA domain-containing protein [Agriterribacter sp.]HRO47919.1 VWA domain-containing protein [Agriterribacter sp.]HRQ19115.1 VWA domain-containing protein [Agriterribacter sp.]
MLRDYFEHIEFANPGVLFLLLIIPVLAGWYISYASRMRGTMMVSSLKSFRNTHSLKNKLRYIPFVMRLLALTCIILALARPQTHNDEKHVEGEGIDIVLCLDVSGSMLAQDFHPNRLEAAKKVAGDFVRNRPADRIGLVVFAGESFTQCPVTGDHAVLESQIYQVDGGFLVDGTAIGSGLATSVDRLRSSEAKSKVVILLTDGENNGGLIDPRTAKEIAKSLGIKVYTIGIGSDGYASTPVQGPGGQIIMQQEKVNIDEPLLEEIAAETGGKYFRAKANQGLEAIYQEIDQLEKTKLNITTTRLYTERFHPMALLAIGFIFVELLLRLTVFRQFP